MLTTSVSLPVKFANVWRRRQRAIMRLAIRTLRVQMRNATVRRGVKRTYNRQGGEFAIVTTRFTEAEYDTLHFAASAMRVSVSWLVYCMIKMWIKRSRRRRANLHVTNYELHLHAWGQNAGILTESLYFYPKYPRLEKTINLNYASTSA
ncbi:hypothetical protein [Turneriella parva]|uniref:Uncharacterized protein n=1 Tax=Turneriella parva (strain ATCC BAA-1111 / DSM 21527 / NCTC 11395 / H) TaxID=869212 RepID=I4B1I9_TURPD|nr:hypothetical protein [Turneriella parva]AFM11146.1 hypothetical protein Turpa_0492 [Turneriella parva DSM 21527]